MKLTNEEKTQYINAVCKQIFKRPYKKIELCEKATLRLNLLIRKRAGEYDNQTFQQLVKHV